MVEKYYYGRVNNKPIITVCLLSQGNTIARGVAICSKQDNPKKVTGKAIAHGRAIKALKKKTKTGIIRRPLIKKTAYMIEACTTGFPVLNCKSNIPRFLTSFEKKILGVKV